MNHDAEGKLVLKPKVLKRDDFAQGGLVCAPIRETATMPQDRVAKKLAHAKAALRGSSALPRPASSGPDDGAGAAARLISKPEVLDRVGVTYPTLWEWMRKGRFPRSRELGGKAARGKVCWLESEIEDWIVSRPIRRLKGDADAPARSSMEKKENRGPGDDQRAAEDCKALRLSNPYSQPRAKYSPVTAPEPRLVALVGGRVRHGACRRMLKSLKRGAGGR